MLHRIPSLALFLLAGISSSASVFATDFYVDAASGNDASSGTSPASAWKTITHASGSSTIGSTTTIHLAPGTYSAATGETFPLVFEGQALVGDAGSAATVIDGGGSGTLLQMTFIPSGSPMYNSLVRGLTFTNAGTAINIYWAWNSLATSLDDVAISNMSAQGVVANGGGTFPGSGASVHLTLDRARCVNCVTGLYLSATSSTSTLIARDSSFEACSGDGVWLGSGTQIQASFERCRFTHNGGRGVYANPINLGRTDALLADCLLAHNAIGYSALTSAGSSNFAHVALTRCTVADNVNIGIQSVFGGGSGGVTTDLDGDIVHGNGTNTVVTTLTTNVFNAIGGADPQFIDRVNDDYRLRFVSPCIDLGNPATPVGTLDLARVARSIDGDLDTNERSDIGCFEFQPLGLVTSGHLSSPLRLEFWGPAGSSAIVYFSRLAPVAPANTPFGQFDLNPGVFGTLIPSINVAPITPVTFQRPIPNNPVLVGRTFSFQARTNSALAPQGSAYTNVVWVTIVP
jgi:hypothetical protein